MSIVRIFRVVFAMSILLAVALHRTTRASEGKVRFTSTKEISYFSAPLTKLPLSSWIDVQKGIYPKLSPINGKINIGEAVTLLIYFRDPSGKYDISVSDCWAYDNEDYRKTENKLNLVNDPKGTKEWMKLNYPRGSNLTSVLYSNFTSFKFPDRDKVYLTCNIKLCFHRCNRHEIT